MKKLLFQLDSDTHPSVFDTVVAYDGGVDHVIGYANCVPDVVQSMVEGAIFTRSGANKKNTALFIGGSSVTIGDAVLDLVQRVFFENFRVSVMLDCNGCNTTAAAAVASILKSGAVKGKKAVILAGTGPVGGRAAVMLAREGAQVSITSRTMQRSEQACRHLNERYGVEIEPLAAETPDQRAALIQNTNIVMATGAAGIKLLEASDWQDTDVEIVLDANAMPPAGIAGVKMGNRGEITNGKIVWGALGFGPFKLALQRHCIASLFEQNDLVLDTDEIFKLAKKLV